MFSEKPNVNTIDIKDVVDEKESGIPRNYKKLIAEVGVIGERATAQVNLLHKY